MTSKIMRDELVNIIKSGKKFKLIDVLSAESYEKEHIRGAISIPVSEIEEKAAKILKKDDLIIIYCASFECQASSEAAEKLTAMGYVNVLDYKGGLKDYKEGNLPLEGSLHIQTARAKQGCC